jgi:adenylate kinase family enzyme
MIRQLGELAINSIKMGEPIKDEIVVHILCETIKTLPQDKGWIIDGFPNTFAQAKLLEKALTGYNEDNPIPAKLKRESILAPNPKPEMAKPKHKSAIDLVIYLDISNDSVLKRSVGRYCIKINLKFISKF